MSALRIYAETAACLLNTGPEVDHATEAIRRSMKEEVLLYYDPSAAFVRCYVQVQRAQPEQFAFEYEANGGDDGPDGDGNGSVDAEVDVFEAFVREARAEVGKTNWRIIDENSTVFTALESGGSVAPETAESDVRALLEAGEPIEFAATDRAAAVGLVAYLRETFDGDHSVAISRAGRVEPVTDADFVIVPDQSYTGLTGGTRDRLERVQLDYWAGELADAMDDVGAAGPGSTAARLADYVDREGLTDRFDVVARPAADSWTGPAVRWFGRVAAVGIVLVAAYLLATRVPRRLVALLERPRRFVFPPPGVSAPAGVPEVDVGYASWIAVVGAGIALGGVAAIGRKSVPSVGLTLPSVGGAAGTGSTSASDGEPPATSFDGETEPERGVGDCLDHIVEAADRETAVEHLTDALADRGVEVTSARTARLYAVGVRAIGVAAGVAVAAVFYIVAGRVLTGVLAALASRWTLVVDALVAFAAVAVVVVVTVRIRAALGSWGATGTGTGTETTDAPAGADAPTNRASAVSRNRIRQLLDRADDPEYLKGNVRPQRLLAELEENPGRTDIAALLREYQQAASVTVVPPDQRELIEPSSTSPTATAATDDDDDEPPSDEADGPDHPDRDRGFPGDAEPGDGPESGGARTTGAGVEADGEAEGPRTGPEPTDEPEPDGEADGPRTGPEPTDEPEPDGEPTPADRDVADGASSKADSPGEATTDRSFRFGNVDPDPDPDSGFDPDDGTDEDVAGGAATDDGDVDGGRGGGGEDRGIAFPPGGADAGGPERFPAFRYDDANSGYVREGTGSDDRPETRWKYRTDHEPLAPVVTEETVYVVDREGGVYAVDDEGEERWTASVEGTVKSSPTVDDGTLYFGSDEGRVHAVSVGGERVWDERIGTPSGPLSRGTAAIITPPTVTDGRVYVGDVEGYVHARDAATGAAAWRVDTGGAIYGKLAARDGKLFVANGDGLLAAYTVDGERRWSSGAGGKITTTPVADEGSWYVVDGSGVAHRLDPTQGGAEVDTFATGAGNPVSPTVGGGQVFLGSRTGTVLAVDDDLTERRWERDTDREDRILAPFLLDEELLYVPAGRHVYAFDPATGRQAWSYRLADEVRVQPAYAGRSLFVATASGRVLALDLDGV